MLTSFSVCTKLNIGNFGILVYKVIGIDLEFVLYLEQLSAEGWRLSISQQQQIRDLG
jgi:hypothetical protein